MRSNTLLALAGLASYTLAIPTGIDPRHSGLAQGLINTITDILKGHSPVDILGGISAHAAAALNGGALGCAAGSIDLSYRQELAAWIRTGAGIHLDASLKTSLLSWCGGDDSVTLSVDACSGLSVFIPTCASIAAEADLYVNLDGVFSLVDNAFGVLSVSAQTLLSSSLAAIGELDVNVKAGLEFCAAGGVVSDLSVDILAALKVWLSGSECQLSATLQATVLSWCEGHIGGDIVSLNTLPHGGLVSLSVGAAVLGLVEESGALVASAQASLSAFLETEFGLDIEADLKVILEGCAKGELATSFGYEARAALSAWLASSSCSLTVELNAMVVFWLSFGVSAGAEVSLGTNIIADLSSFLVGTVESLLGSQLHGLISLLLSGEGLLSISLEARAQLAAICGGAAGIDIDASIQIILIGWLTGCRECCIPSGSLTTGTMIPSTVSVPGFPSGSLTTGTMIPSTVSVPGVPSGSLTTGTMIPSTVSVPGFPSGSLTTGTMIPSTVSVPGAPSESLTTETVIPTPISVPSATGATETSTPCDTITSETVISSTISVPGVSTTSVPAGTPSGSSPTETGAPSESLTTQTTVTVTATATVSVSYCATTN
ncbi:hypothetical protein P175DRAFT_0487244 [Aspergillus ochraceoroseus IBT 24754]|uniref:Cell wall protein n=1 Tax=Aspergillus ochraceoroseus IBT 24754 TaxID=1392256 RepID=A0A2T5LMS9_9EURO|nr:uncharacterized protein P175DRAFT_0487244 [Aspergillus ochraceoroseus IBT 24754]PTU17577.1 hypothetical protein P175DRAFT_0487244 [Aspergillus ochraceoroseus IBT 24754]